MYIFEFMIKTAPQGSNSVNGREPTLKLLILRITLFSGCMNYEVTLFALEEFGVQVQIPVGLLPVLFS